MEDKLEVKIRNKSYYYSLKELYALQKFIKPRKYNLKYMELKFKKLREDAVLPSYAHDSDAGLDLTAVGFTQEFDKSGKLILVYHTGVAAEIPEGYVGLLFCRSSIANKSLTLTNCVGVIDSKIFVVIL